MSPRSAHGGFMEPIRHTTYYEDVYTRSKRDDDDPVEAGGRPDLCEESEDSSDDKTNEKSSKRTKKHSKHLTPYGTIKKPTYKPRTEVKRKAAYKIAPKLNARHSVRPISIPSDEEAQPKHLDVSATQKVVNSQHRAREPSAEAFAQEKMAQRRLSPSIRFNKIRRQRMDDRTQVHKASQRAQMTKERALQDAAAAEACLVETVPEPSLYVLVKSKEAPIGFVDCIKLSSSQVGGRVMKRKEHFDAKQAMATEDKLEGRRSQAKRRHGVRPCHKRQARRYCGMILIETQRK